MDSGKVQRDSMIFENTLPGTTVWNAEYGFGELKSKSPDFKEDHCMLVYFERSGYGLILVPRKDLTEIEKEEN